MLDPAFAKDDRLDSSRFQYCEVVVLLIVLTLDLAKVWDMGEVGRVGRKAAVAEIQVKETTTFRWKSICEGRTTSMKNERKLSPQPQKFTIFSCWLAMILRLSWLAVI